MNLRKVNSKKYCLSCNATMDIEIKGNKCHCIKCGRILFILCDRKKEKL